MRDVGWLPLRFSFPFLIAILKATGNSLISSGGGGGGGGGGAKYFSGRIFLAPGWLRPCGEISYLVVVMMLQHTGSDVLQ